MTAGKKQLVGSKRMPDLDAKLDRNQDDLVDALIEPHPKLPERGGGQYKITSRVPVYNPEAQPTTARGHIVWSRAYRFQPHGPTYIDPVPDPGGQYSG